MHDLKAIYDKIFDYMNFYAKEYFEFDGNAKFYPRQPKMTDMEVISLSLAADCLEINSENLLWSKITKDYPNMFPRLIHRTKYNLRRKKLYPVLSQVLNKFAQILEDNIGDEILIIDSMPLPICKLSREHTSTVCRDRQRDEVLATKSFNSSLGGYYIGYKFHLITTKSGVYKDMLISSANVHDNYFLKLLNKEDTHLANIELLADRGYVGRAIQLSLFEDLSLSLNVPYRRNQKDFRKYPFDKKLIRKTIEVVFAQYCDEFRIRENYAKRFEGLYIKIVTKVCAKTFKQFYNFINGKPINQTKHALAA